jgi:hypothetical protein
LRGKFEQVPRWARGWRSAGLCQTFSQLRRIEQRAERNAAHAKLGDAWIGEMHWDLLVFARAGVRAREARRRRCGLGMAKTKTPGEGLSGR